MTKVINQSAVGIMLVGLCWIAQGVNFAGAYPGNGDAIVLCFGAMMAALGAICLLSVERWL